MVERDLDNLENYSDYEEDDNTNYEDLVVASRLTKDLMRASATLKKGEVRYLVDQYYNMQKHRIRAAAQVRSSTIKDENGEVIEEPNDLVQYMFTLYRKLEDDMKVALGKYAQSTIVGQWALSVMGIGPVIAAGLLCHIDPEIAKTSGDVWRYGGYDASCVWYGTDKARKIVKDHVGTAKIIEYPELELICADTSRKIENWLKIPDFIDPETKSAKTEAVIAQLAKRPWNASLKRLGYLAGQSFVKSSNREGSDYGWLYNKRKTYETTKNENFEYADQAKAALENKNYGSDTIARKFYEMGMLPPAHIQRRVERYVVKIFLSHYFQVAYEAEHHKEMPKPWILESQPDVHTHYIAPPKWPIIGFERDFVRTYS